jgi:hypothetical protein
MAMRHRELPAEGVQFHPESVLTAEGKHLLANFLGVSWPLDGVAASPLRVPGPLDALEPIGAEEVSR